MRKKDNERVTRHTTSESLKDKIAEEKAKAEADALAAAKARRQAEINRIQGAIAELNAKIVEMENQKEIYNNILSVLTQIMENTSGAGNNMKEGRQLLVEGMNTIERNGGLMTIDKIIAENEKIVYELRAAIAEINQAITKLELEIQQCYAKIDGCYEALSSM